MKLNFITYQLAVVSNCFIRCSDSGHEIAPIPKIVRSCFQLYLPSDDLISVFLKRVGEILLSLTAVFLVESLFFGLLMIVST